MSVAVVHLCREDPVLPFHCGNQQLKDLHRDLYWNVFLFLSAILLSGLLLLSKLWIIGKKVLVKVVEEKFKILGCHF